MSTQQSAHETELRTLNNIALAGRPDANANRALVEYTFSVVRRYFNPGSILELGPAEGIMTDLLVTLNQPLTLVEGSEAFCNQIRARHPGLTVVHSLFEGFTPANKFDNILMGHVLEHVENPIDILRKARSWLAPGGRILAAVPNSRSLHRQAAVLMGLLPFEESLNESDTRQGHRRVYNPETFRRDFNEAGLKIEVFGGYWIKPVSNAQIEASWSEAMLSSFMKLGERYPDIGAEIYIIAKA